MFQFFLIQVCVFHRKIRNYSQIRQNTPSSLYITFPKYLFLKKMQTFFVEEICRVRIAKNRFIPYFAQIYY